MSAVDVGVASEQGSCRDVLGNVTVVREELRSYAVIDGDDGDGAAIASRELLSAAAYGEALDEALQRADGHIREAGWADWRDWRRETRVARAINRLGVALILMPSDRLSLVELA